MRQTCCTTVAEQQGLEHQELVGFLVEGAKVCFSPFFATGSTVNASEASTNQLQLALIVGVTWAALLFLISFMSFTASASLGNVNLSGNLLFGGQALWSLLFTVLFCLEH